MSIPYLGQLHMLCALDLLCHPQPELYASWQRLQEIPPEWKISTKGSINDMRKSKTMSEYSLKEVSLIVNLVDYREIIQDNKSQLQTICNSHIIVATQIHYRFTIFSSSICHTVYYNVLRISLTRKSINLGSLNDSWINDYKNTTMYHLRTFNSKSSCDARILLSWVSSL